MNRCITQTNLHRSIWCDTIRIYYGFLCIPHM